MIHDALHPFPKGGEQEDDDKRQDQGEHKRIAAAGGEKEGVEEKDHEDIEPGENAGQEEIDRSPADEGADVQKVIFEDAEGEKNGRDKAEIPQRVDGNTADGQDRQCQEQRGKPQPPEDVLDPISLMVVRGLLHRAIENRKTVDDRKGDHR